MDTKLNGIHFFCEDKFRLSHIHSAAAVNNLPCNV